MLIPDSSQLSMNLIRRLVVFHGLLRWFNFRASKHLVSTSFQSFWNWFDSRSWYPLGRVAGGTLYPVLMVTSGIIYKILHMISLPVDIRNICVLLAPGFSALTAFATYLFTREMSGDGAGLLAAAFIGIAPGNLTHVTTETRVHFTICRRIIRQ
jgi:dolichyl-diphosphooligosaccharide---protein glycosyltransferase